MMAFFFFSSSRLCCRHFLLVFQDSGFGGEDREDGLREVVQGADHLHVEGRNPKLAAELTQQAYHFHVARHVKSMLVFGTL